MTARNSLNRVEKASSLTLFCRSFILSEKGHATRKRTEGHSVGRFEK